MARGDLTERTLTIFFLLLEKPRTQSELAKHFAVNTRTIQRDITALSKLIPLYDEPDESDRRQIIYRLPEDFTFRPPQLTAMELAVLLLAQESIALTGLTVARSPFTGAARSLLAKVRATLPLPLRDQLDALSSVYGTAATPAKDFARHADTITRLTSAALSRRQVRLRYDGLTSGDVSDRIFEPYAVYFDPDGATLKTIGYDYARRNVIPFSIDRIKELSLTDETFARPIDFNLRDHLTEHCFNGIHGAPIDVKLKAYGVTARIFAERTFHPSQRIIEQTCAVSDVQSETTTIEMRVAQGRGLLRFILGWLPDIEVISPAAVKAEVAAAIDSASARFATANRNRKSTNTDDADSDADYTA